MDKQTYIKTVYGPEMKELKVFVKDSDGLFRRFRIRFTNVKIYGKDLIIFPKESEDEVRSLIQEDAIFKADLNELRDNLKTYRDRNFDNNWLEMTVLIKQLNIPAPVDYIKRTF